jgi:hypothetical protein
MEKSVGGTLSQHGSPPMIVKAAFATCTPTPLRVAVRRSGTRSSRTVRRARESASTTDVFSSWKRSVSRNQLAPSSCARTGRLPTTGRARPIGPISTSLSSSPSAVTRSPFRAPFTPTMNRTCRPINQESTPREWTDRAGFASASGQVRKRNGSPATRRRFPIRSLPSSPPGSTPPAVIPLFFRQEPRSKVTPSRRRE